MLEVIFTVLGSFIIAGEKEEKENSIILKKPLAIFFDPVNKGIGFADIGFQTIEIPKAQFIEIKVAKELENLYITQRSNLVITSTLPKDFNKVKP